ncbi:hypothetical protein DL769_006340 [Monosporascus sp. CRB-8-3]|nr:hypothetical protein DL769_006340 [Monosporascus sp. CRB-8-3]
MYLIHRTERHPESNNKNKLRMLEEAKARKKKRDATLSPPCPFTPQTYRPSGAVVRVSWNRHQQQNQREREQTRQRLAEEEAQEQQQ